MNKKRSTQNLEKSREAKTATVLFVENTKVGILAKNLREVIERLTRQSLKCSAWKGFMNLPLKFGQNWISKS